MVENTIVTKLGSESNDSQHTQFSSTTNWSLGAGDLIVYKNGVLQTSASDYTVLSNNSIQFNSPIQITDKVMMMVSKLMEASNLMTYDDRVVQVDRVSKKLEGKAQTAVEKRIFEEGIPSNFIIHTNDVWASTVDPTPANAITQGFAFAYSQFILSQDITVSSNRGWFATSNGILTGRIINWIPPRFGQGYTIRLFDSHGTEIPSSDPMGWQWDYQAGYLFIENTHSYSMPFKINGWRYTGSYGSGSVGAAYWKNPAPTFTALPIYGNLDGDMRLVLDTNSIWRWNSLQNQWISTNFASARFKDPVADIISLPPTANIDGDIRLVLGNNTLYRWNGTTHAWQVIIPVHNHDDRYFTETEINSMLALYAPLIHTHDTLYYRKEEVDSLVRWRPSVMDQAHLPPYTENRDGDVILTRDQNIIWRWIGNIANPKWIPIVYGNLSWKPPVTNHTDLPSIGNVVGDVRLVVNDNGTAYWWDGTTWQNFTNPLHTHDDRYYTKVQIDTALRWKAPVNTFANLPVSGNTDGDARLTLANNNVYRWDGTLNQWVLFSASPRWREMVPLLTNLPTIGNIDGDVRFVKEKLLLYEWEAATSVWKPIGAPVSNMDDRYYTKYQLDNGQLDTRYFTQQQITALFNVNTGHNHDGINSKKIDYNNLLNLPTFYWKAPVADVSSLPTIGNTIGDARLTLTNPACYVWTGVQWYLVDSGVFAPIDHNHDVRYYTKAEIDQEFEDLTLWITAQLAMKADINHTHDDRYYTKTQVDAKFDITHGHNHDGYNSRRISYYDLIDLPIIPQFNPNDYWTKTELEAVHTPAVQMINWENVFNKPDLANTHWKSPVQTVLDLPNTGNEIDDIRLVLDTSDIYVWNGIQWNVIGHWQNNYVAYWREPIDAYDDLPLGNLNVNGDVRLVLSENKLYRWDSSLNFWVSLVSTATNVQVYLNGLQLLEGVEWVRVKEKAIDIIAMDPDNPSLPAVRAGDKVTMVIAGDYYIRRDFIAQTAQTIFEVFSSYHREDIVVSGNPTTIRLTFPYILHGANLIVWLNGLLKRVNEDYYEINPTQFAFQYPLNPGDHVIAIIMEQASGEGEYIREDQVATAGQTTFGLSNFYIPGSGRLLVYFNGDLLKNGTDYYELSNTTIETLNPMIAGDKFSFILLGQGISGGCCNAEDVILGIPTDKTWNDGLLYFFEQMKVNDAIDQINETLLQMAPTPPTNFNGKALVLTLSLVPGYESQGNTNYETVAGAYHTYLTETTTFTVETPDQTGFADADKGSLSLYINDVLVDQFSLYNAFVVLNANGNQSSVSYGSQSQGARQNEGIGGTSGAIRNSTNGKISVMSVGKYNNFKMWQKGDIRINITPGVLRQGYNTIYLTHVDGTNFTRRTNTLKLFLDTASSRPHIDISPGLTALTQISNKYISGVRYYSIGDTFNTDFVTIGAFSNTYTSTPFSISMPGLQPLDIAFNDPHVFGPASPPRIGDLAEYNGPFALNKFSDYSIDAVLTIACRDPFGVGPSTQTASQHNLVNTFTNGSTDLIEYFRDEKFRLPLDSYDTIPTRTDQWNSSAVLTNGNALIFNLRLKYPNINFTTPYRPQPQIANYSSFTGAQAYIRSFYKVAAKNSGTFIINGITLQDLQNNRILIDLKLPTQTGWMSLNKPYDVIIFKGLDGDGCLLNSDGGQHFTYSSGTFSTANSDYMIIARITLPNSTAPEIIYMELQW
jgi:hypothetical protein